MKKAYTSPKIALDLVTDVITTSIEVETEKIPFNISGTAPSSIGYNTYVNPDNFELDN